MENNINKILNILKEFLDIPSVVGFEKPFMDYLNKKAKELNIETIQKDNYLFLKSKNNSNILFSVHIDRQGFCINEKGRLEYATNYLKKKKGLKFRRQEQEKDEIELKNILNEVFEGNIDYTNFRVYLDDLFLRFKFNLFNLSFFRQDGALDCEKIGLRYVREDIVSYDNSGNKLNEYKIIRYDLDWRNHSILFGINNKLDNDDLRRAFMLKSNLRIFDDMFSGQIDNVISVTVLFYLLENNEFSPNIIFTCGEEMGESYKSIINFYEDFSDLILKSNLKLIVLDTSPYYDFIDKKDGFLVLRHGDERGGFDNSLTEDIKEYLEKNNISYDFKPSYLGRTELGKVAKETNGKINGGTLQLPSLNYHTNYETSTFKSLENYCKVIEYLGSK